MNPQQYITDNNLWDIKALKAHAQLYSVYVIESIRFPRLVMLHYMDSCQWDNTWTEFSRMSRGLILDLTNKQVIAHPFDKFFNMDQMPETSYEKLVQEGSFQISEKLDGSMLILFKDPTTQEVHFTTKGSFDSDHGVYATKFLLPLQLKSSSLIEEYTLMFELISSQFRNVINYTKKGYSDGVYLIGARVKQTGRLLTYEEVHSLAKSLDVPTFKTYTFESLDSLLENAKELPVLEEGYVLRFENGLLVKVKGPAYLKAHRFISRLSDKNILEAVGEGVAKELSELAPEEYKDDVLAKIDYFKSRCDDIMNMCYTKFTEAPKTSRKDFALWVNKEVDSYLRGFLFTLMDKKPLDNKHVCRVLGELEKVSGETKI